MRTAYLVGCIDTKTNPPKFLGADIFSEPSPTVEGSKFTFVIVSASAEQYESAVAKLDVLIDMYPTYKWAKPKTKRKSMKGEVVVGRARR